MRRSSLRLLRTLCEPLRRTLSLLSPLMKRIVVHTVAQKSWRNFNLVSCELCFRGSGGGLARDIPKAEAKNELQRIHNLSCGDNDIRLYRLLKIQGYCWPEIAKEAVDIQKGCSRRQESLDLGESMFVSEVGDWKQLCLDFLQHRVLPPRYSNLWRFRESCRDSCEKWSFLLKGL